jgi:hypothetical protein
VRRALGFPKSTYEKYFGQFAGLTAAKAGGGPLETSTPFYLECTIAKELGVTLEGSRKLPRRERYVWYLYYILANEKESAAYEKIKNKTPAAGEVGGGPRAAMRDYM